jgi:Spy/CpxP family protein refolding chaperone
MKRVHRAREALRKAESEMASLRAETLSRVAAILTPAQREKVALFQSQTNALRDFTFD